MRIGSYIFLEKKSLAQPTPEEIEIFTGARVGGSVTVDQALSVPAVAAAVRLISEATATLDINIVPRNGKGETITEHDGLDLLRGQVNDWLSGFEFIRDLTAQALTNDKGGMAWVNRVADKPAEIIHYAKGTIDADLSRETGEPSYKINNRPIPMQDIIHVRGPFSRCPISLAREAIGAAIVMEAHTTRLFKNGARPSGVVAVPRGTGEDAIKKARSGFNAAYAGEDKAGKTMFIYDGMTFTQMQISSVDAQFLELRRFQLEEIARAFGMSASQLGDLTKSSYANASHKQLELIIYVIEPWLCALEAAFNRSLLTEEERKTLTFKFDRDDLSRASLTERATAINSLIASETINPNTGRSWLGLQPYTGGETYGNRNVAVSTPPPNPDTKAEPDGQS